MIFFSPLLLKPGLDILSGQGGLDHARRLVDREEDLIVVLAAAGAGRVLAQVSREVMPKTEYQIGG